MHKGIFLHGGPGLNSEAERRFVAPVLKARGLDIHFWDEPSLNRPEGFSFRPERAFSRYLDAIEEALDKKGPFEAMIGSSFGALVALHALKRRPAMKLSRLVMVSPTLDLNSVHRRMMDLAAGDFDLSRPELAACIRALKARSRALNDSAMREAMGLVYQDPALFGHYWVDPQALGRWAAILGEPRYGVDGASQAAVIEDFLRAEEPWPSRPYPFGVTLLMGERDPVAEEAKTIRLLEPHFADVRVTRFAKSGHFPQLDEPEEFARALKACF